MSAEATTGHEHQETLQDPSGELILCLRGGGYDEKVLHVHSQRCTLGGCADCTVQLPDAAPLQCVILRGPSGTAVHDWTGQSLLNGQPFFDAALKIGDCLQIGCVEVKVLADWHDEPHFPPAPAPDRSVTAQSRKREIEVTSEAFHVRFDRIEERLSSLERMIGELLDLQCHVGTHAADTESERIVHPVGTPETEMHEDPECDPPALLYASDSNLSTRPPSRPVESARTPARIVPDESQTLLGGEQRDEEELGQSVQEYLQRLLGPTSTPKPEPVAVCKKDPATQPDRKTEEEVCIPAPANDIAEVIAKELAPDPPELEPARSPLTPLRRSTECETNLNAMREVANLSATVAIRKHDNKEAVRKTMHRLLLIALVVGPMVLYAAFSSGRIAMSLGIGAVALAGALIVWQVLVVSLLRRRPSTPGDRERRTQEAT